MDPAHIPGHRTCLANSRHRRSSPGRTHWATNSGRNRRQADPARILESWRHNPGHLAHQNRPSSRQSLATGGRCSHRHRCLLADLRTEHSMLVVRGRNSGRLDLAARHRCRSYHLDLQTYCERSYDVKQVHELLSAYRWNRLLSRARRRLGLERPGRNHRSRRPPYAGSASSDRRERHYHLQANMLAKVEFSFAIKKLYQHDSA